MFKGLAVTVRNVLPKSRPIKPVWIASLLLSVALLLLPFLVKLDGKTHADWQQFFGRFHPLAVHLPIGFLLLVPLLELGGRFRPALRESAGFVLALSFVSCIGAVMLGYLLAYGSGNAGAGVTRHMWGGICLTLGVLLCLLVRPAWESGGMPRVYPGILTAVLLLMAWAAHQGGSLTHGNNYLTEYLPAPLKHLPLIGASKTQAGSDSFYSRHINPVLDANCVTCHGEGKVKGGLRLDTYDFLMKGGQDGAAIVPGHPEKSLLLERVTLPAGHKQFMPAEGKPPLKPEEIVWIKAWVLQGASPTVASLQGISIRENFKEPPLRPVGDYSTLMPQIAQMANSQGAKLLPVSGHPSDGLILNTVDVSATFNDAQLAQLDKFAPYIVEVELGRTSVTDACFDTLRKFSNLRAIHLEGTAVTGSGLAKLSRLSELTYLNLSGTRVTKSAIAPLGAMKNLRHLYLYNTPAQPALATEATPSPARSSP